MEAPPAAWSCWPMRPSAGTPVIAATMPPSCVSWPPLLLLCRDAVTRLRPSTITMYCCSGVNGALSNGSVKSVVVAAAAGRQVASPCAAPSG